MRSACACAAAACSAARAAAAARSASAWILANRSASALAATAACSFGFGLAGGRSLIGTQGFRLRRISSGAQGFGLRRRRALGFDALDFRLSGGRTLAPRRLQPRVRARPDSLQDRQRRVRRQPALRRLLRPRPGAGLRLRPRRARCRRVPAAARPAGADARRASQAAGPRPSRPAAKSGTRSWRCHPAFRKCAKHRRERCRCRRPGGACESTYFSNRADSQQAQQCVSARLRDRAGRRRATWRVAQRRNSALDASRHRQTHRRQAAEEQVRHDRRQRLVVERTRGLSQVNIQLIMPNSSMVSGVVSAACFRSGRSAPTTAAKAGRPPRAPCRARARGPSAAGTSRPRSARGARAARRRIPRRSVASARAAAPAASGPARCTSRDQRLQPRHVAVGDLHQQLVLVADVVVQRGLATCRRPRRPGSSTWRDNRWRANSSAARARMASRWSS